MDKTLEYYNNVAKGYVDETLEVEVSELNEFFLKYMPKKAHILDLGCGSGRDSKIFIEKGYSVLALDGAKEFCKLASEIIGQEVVCKSFSDIDYTNEFDGVWACASILHVEFNDLISIFKIISRALKVGGYLFTCFKYGNFEGQRNGRYFTDLTERTLEKIIENLNELEIIEIKISTDVRVGRENEKWLNVIIRKKI